MCDASEHNVQLRADKVLHDRPNVHRARSFALALLGLIEQVSDDRSERL